MSYNGADLIFPHLNIVIQNLENHITLFGGFDVAFYGIIIGIGMLLGLFYAVKSAAGHGEDPEIVYNFFIFAIIFGVIGARIYYVAFEWENYAGDLLKILNIREGGLAIYGGVIAGVAAGAVYCRVKKYSFVKLADMSLPGVILAQGIGRWGNFFNCEAFGEYTDSLFAMRMKLSMVNQSMVSQDHLDHLITDGGVQYIQAHPTFLYESCWDLLSFAILCVYSYRQKLGTGRTMLGYFLLYGTGRFFIEGLRTDQLLVPGTSVPASQLLSLILVIFSVSALLYRRGKNRHPGSMSG